MEPDDSVGGDASGDPAKSRYIVQSADKVLQILNLFLADNSGHSVGSIAAATGIPRPTVFRLLSTLEAQAYVTRQEGRYQLGHKCILLGAAAVGALDLQEQARPVMLALREKTTESIQLCVLTNWQVVYIEQELSLQSVGYMTSRVGSIRPAYCTGVGKALLAYQPEHELQAWMATTKFDRFTPNTLCTAEALAEDLALVRRRGFAIDDEEREVGVRCVAAPITDHRGDVIASISAAAPWMRAPKDLVHSEFARDVVDAARTISIRLGCPEDRCKAGRST